MTRHAWALPVAVACGLLAPHGPACAAQDSQLAALKRLSVDELLNVEITSVSRREEGLRDAAAAITVVTNEDLRRSGATSIPEALRLVPGIHVGRQSSTSWAVSSRGFSSVTSEKLLVLSDTRSIYTPLFSGVAWDVQDYLLEDVERIEVIRGPGAALWGSNAVNGVINITTRSARDTHGNLFDAGAGTFEGYWLSARHGGETAGGSHYRVFGRYADHGGTQDIQPDTDDEWQLGHLGFRADGDAAHDWGWTLQGDAYAGKIGALTPAVTIIGRPGPAGELEADVSGGNLLTRWRKSTGQDSDLQLRAYYDYTRRDDPSFLDTLQTLDLDLQQRFSLRAKHEVTWGLNYRLTSNRNESGGIFAVDPEKSDDQLISGFIQDQIALGRAVRLTLGTKLEHNDFSGFEVQPSVRLAWLVNPRQTLWSSVSRAVRVPTRLERDVRIDATDPLGNPVARLLGNPDFDAEELIAYELGYRWEALSNLSFDVAFFYNDYQSLSSLEFGAPFIDVDGRTVFPVENQNLGRGSSTGAELLAEWYPVRNWRLTASYSHVDLDLESSGQDLNRGVWYDGSTPRGQFALRSLFTFGEAFELDAHFRHQTQIRRLPVDPSGAGVDAHAELDLRFGWRPRADWELSLVAQNLLHDEHVEFGPPEATGALERAIYARAVWRHP